MFQRYKGVSCAFNPGLSALAPATFAPLSALLGREPPSRESRQSRTMLGNVARLRSLAPFKRKRPLSLHTMALRPSAAAPASKMVGPSLLHHSPNLAVVCGLPCRMPILASSWGHAVVHLSISGVPCRKRRTSVFCAPCRGPRPSQLCGMGLE